MKKWLNRLSVAALVLATAGIGRADEPVTLRYKMNPEKPSIYKSVHTTEQTQKVSGQEIKTTMTKTDIAEHRLDRIDEKGNLVLTTENKRLKIKVKIDPVGEFEYDSQASEQETGTVLSAALNPVFDLLSGSELKVTLSPRGDVISVEGLKELLADVGKDNPIAAGFTGGGSDEAGKMSVADLFAVFSENPVKPGDTWETTYEMVLPNLGKAVGKKVFTYDGPDSVGETPTVKLSVVNEMEFDLDIDIEASKATGKLSISDSSGTIQFDPAAGRIVAMKTSVTMGGELSVDVNGQVLTIDNETVQTNEIQLLEKLPE